MSSGVVAVAEAALGHIELRRADAQIEEGTGQGLDGECFHGFVEAVEPTVVHTQSSTEASEALLRCGKSTFVAVDAEHLQVWPAIEQLLGVTTTTQRGVEHEPWWHLFVEGHDLVGHHRQVVEGCVAHRVLAVIVRPSAAHRFASAAGMSPGRAKRQRAE